MVKIGNNNKESLIECSKQTYDFIEVFIKMIHGALKLSPAEDIPGRIAGADEWAIMILREIASGKINFNTAFNPNPKNGGDFILAREKGVEKMKDLLYKDSNAEKLKYFNIGNEGESSATNELTKTFCSQISTLKISMSKLKTDM